MIVPDDCSRVADLEPPENIDDEKKEEDKSNTIDIDETQQSSVQTNAT